VWKPKKIDKVIEKEENYIRESKLVMSTKIVFDKTSKRPKLMEDIRRSLLRIRRRKFGLIRLLCFEDRNKMEKRGCIT